MKKLIPSLITSIRIIGAIVLIFLTAMSPEFLIVYGVCGASDAADGFVARKLHAESKFGNILDSISDLFFYGVLAIKIFPVMQKLLSMDQWIIVIVATAFQLISYIICLFKFRKFSALHTYANKALSFIIFFFPFALIGEISLLYDIYIYFGGAIALYAGIEIILIHILAKEYDIRNKSIFFLRRHHDQEELNIE